MSIFDEYRQDVDVQAVIGEDNQSVRVRRSPGTDGIWLRPSDGLDGDGEIYLTVPKLAIALQALGFTEADIKGLATHE